MLLIQISVTIMNTVLKAFYYILLMLLTPLKFVNYVHINNCRKLKSMMSEVASNAIIFLPNFMTMNELILKFRRAHRHSDLTCILSFFKERKDPNKESITISRQHI